jgi:hypothetical protein
MAGENVAALLPAPSPGVVTSPLGGPDVVVPVCPFTHDENNEVQVVASYLQTHSECYPVRVGREVLLAVSGIPTLGAMRLFATCHLAPIRCRADAYDFYREKLDLPPAEVLP